MELEPWRAAGALLAVLRGQVAYEEIPRKSNHFPSGSVALVLTLPVNTNGDAQRHVRVALDLLHTLWIVNRDAWREAMTDCVAVKMPTALVTSATKSVASMAVVVSLKHDTSPEQVTRARWETLLDPRVRLTKAEASVKRQIFQAYAQDRVHATTEAIPLRLQFAFLHVRTASMVPAYVTKAAEMVEAVRDHLMGDASTTPETCTPLALESLELNLTSHEMTSEIARNVRRLHALGVRFHRLEVRVSQDDTKRDGHECDHDYEEDAVDRDRFLTVLLAANNNGAPTDIVGPGLTIETLSVADLSLVKVRELCIALESTRRVQNLRLQDVVTSGSLTDRALKWKWLTRAVFAPSSQTSIKHLTLCESDLGWSGMHSITKAMREGNKGDHALEALTLDCQVASLATVEAITMLLEMIGRGLASLSVRLFLNVAVRSTTVVLMQRACPNLRALYLSNVRLDSMDVFLDAYERRNCQIRSLHLHGVVVHHESVTAFALALCDSSRRASRVLRELCLEHVGVGNELNQDNLDAFHSLLETRHSLLEYLQLRVTDELFLTNRSRFLAHHRTWGSGVDAVLPLACKTAFLSVCQACGPNKTPPPVPHRAHEVASDTLSLIFQFAAARTWRNVRIEGPYF